MGPNSSAIFSSSALCWYCSFINNVGIRVPLVINIKGDDMNNEQIERLNRVETTLAVLVAWLTKELGSAAVKHLLDGLYDTKDKKEIHSC